MKEAIDMVIRFRKCQRSLGDDIVWVKYCVREGHQLHSSNTMRRESNLL